MILFSSYACQTSAQPSKPKSFLAQKAASTKKWIQKNPTKVALTLAATAALIAATILTLKKASITTGSRTRPHRSGGPQQPKEPNLYSQLSDEKKAEVNELVAQIKEAEMQYYSRDFNDPRKNEFDDKIRALNLEKEILLQSAGN